MSFTEKLGSLMHRPNDDLASKDDSPWWMKYSARGLGSVGGAFSVFVGVFDTIWSILFFKGFTAVLGGTLVAFLGFGALVAEAPCCCMFVDYVQEVSNQIDKRPYWNRAAFYLITSAIAVFMSSFGIWAIFSCGLIFASGLLYGSMALGPKAPLPEMRSNASVYTTKNQQFPPAAAASNSNLVEGVQPLSFSNPFDSRV